MSTSVATFPQLKTTELVSALVDIGVQITADDVDRPTPAKAIITYCWFLQSLTQLSLEDVKIGAQNTLDTTPDDHIDIYRETAHVSAIWVTLNQIMQWACIDDFSPRDIRDPQSQRYRRILSGLLNYWLFEQDQLPNLVAREDQSQQLQQDQSDLERKYVEAQNQLELKKQDIVKQSAQAEEMEKEVGGMRNILLEKRNIANELSTQIETAKRSRAALQADLESHLQTVSSHEVDINRLRSRIVRSPDRVKASLSDLSKQIGVMKENIADYESQARDHSLRVQALKKYEGELSGVIRIMEEYDLELTKAAHNAAKLSGLNDEKDTRHEEVRDLEQRKQMTTRRINAALEQQQRHGKQAEAKRETITRRLRELQDTHELLMSKRQDADEESAKRHRAIALKEREILELVKSLDADIAQGEAAYRELKMEVLSYSAKLNKALDALNAYNAI